MSYNVAASNMCLGARPWCLQSTFVMQLVNICDAISTINGGEMFHFVFY